MKTEVVNERAAQLLAHRATHAAEHDPENGKIHGFCIVCGVPWPCEIAQPWGDELSGYVVRMPDGKVQWHDRLDRAEMDAEYGETVVYPVGPPLV